jgi:hypothetical protein
LKKLKKAAVKHKTLINSVAGMVPGGAAAAAVITGA